MSLLHQTTLITFQVFELRVRVLLKIPHSCDTQEGTQHIADVLGLLLVSKADASRGFPPTHIGPLIQDQQKYDINPLPLQYWCKSNIFSRKRIKRTKGAYLVDHRYWETEKSVACSFFQLLLVQIAILHIVQEHFFSDWNTLHIRVPEIILR